MDVRECFSPDEIIWENLRTEVNENAQVKLILNIINVVTIIFSAFFIIIIEKQRIEEYPPLLCPSS